jgi:hypothetical protein
MAPKRFLQITSFIIILFYALSFGLLPASAEAQNVPSLNNFVTSVENGHSTIIRGLYARDIFALPVIQQPKDNPGFVANADDVVTEFSMAQRYGTIGMLAHNHKAGQYFPLLKLGDKIDVVYGNGNVETFIVTKVQRYQALAPNNPYTPFIDLETGEQKTVEQVFFGMYTGERHLTLQTCIAEGDELSWGRLFIIAEPLPAAAHSVEAETDR